MKKIILTLTLVLSMALACVPAFADDNDGKLNLNTVTVEQLEKVPGLNHDLAEKIIELRQENEEFVDMDELLDVDGITPAMLRKLGKHIYLEAASSCNC